MRTVAFLAVLSVFLAMPACNPTPSPSPMPPDASDASVSQCAAACAALPKACAEGQASTCATTLANIQANRLVRNPTTGLPLTCADQLTPAVLSALHWCGQ